MVYWFELARGPGGTVDWIPHLIDNDSGIGRQIGVMDVNGDGHPDFIIGNKKGTFVFLSQAKKVSEADWKASLPAVKFADAGDRQLRADEVIQRTK